MTQQEKHEAIRRVYPHIPTHELAAIARQIVTESDLYRIPALAGAFVRHERTDYDRRFQQERHYYDGVRQGARFAVAPKVQAIRAAWL